MSAPLLQREGTIVVGISFDDRSAVALRRALALARTFGALVRVVHAIPWGEPPLRVDEDEVRARVADWALRSAKVVLDAKTIVCRLEEPAAALAHEARARGAALVVVGSSRSRSGDGVADRLVRATPSRLLIAQSPRHRAAIVAATDLSDHNYPVARAAVAWAAAYEARVTLIHNLEKLSESRDVKRKQIWPALRDLFFLTRSLGPVQRAHLSRAPSTTVAISELVRAQRADLLVVGARRGGGRIVAELLASTSSSVLVVPIGHARVQ